MGSIQPDYPRFISTIEKAINTKRELTLKVFPDSEDRQTAKPIETSFQPYIYGTDVMGYLFVWGYLPFHETFYRFILDQLAGASMTGTAYTALPNIRYYGCAEEEHYAILDGFHSA